MSLRVAFYAPLKAPTHPVPSGDRRMGRLLMRALALGGHDVRLACTLRTRDDARIPNRAERLAALGRGAADLLVRRWRGDPPDLWFTYHLYHKAPDHTGPVVGVAVGIAERQERRIAQKRSDEPVDRRQLSVHAGLRAAAGDVRPRRWH